ncbi:MAG: flagellar basal-body rod protein FlgG [Bacillota bacterium]|nr:flagellar basal-body rod protein FlgG [Bacillota bacterium]HWR55127.1 flagellar basal-body rod protein FlgG [Negativicutes bacterium]
MMRALWTAASGMIAQQANVDVISNNLANVNTTGFKKSRVDFQDLVYQNLREAGAPSGQGEQLPTGLQFGHGVRAVSTQKIYTQGNYQETGNTLDVVIEGNGFFQITMPDGSIAYTRDGALKRDGQGRIVTSEGYLLEPQITLPEDAQSVTISSSGMVSVKLPGDTTPQEIGQIQLATFVNPAGLNNVGRNLMTETAASGAPITGTPGENGLGTITQGFLEMSNVQVVEEMVNMIVAQRAYEVNSKAIQTSDTMLEEANNLRR